MRYVDKKIRYVSRSEGMQTCRYVEMRACRYVDIDVINYVDMYIIRDRNVNNDRQIDISYNRYKYVFLRAILYTPPEQQTAGFVENATLPEPGIKNCTACDGNPK